MRKLPVLVPGNGAQAGEPHDALTAGAATPEGGDRRQYVRCVRAEYPSFVQLLESMPPDRLEYRPGPGLPSARLLASRIARCQRLAGTLIDCGVVRWNDDGPMREPQHLIAAYRRDHAALLVRLDRMTDAEWMQPARFDHPDGTIEAPAGQVLWTLLLDAVEARGRLAVYASLLGVDPVP